jgi:parallel beta-helix repeat protein
VRRGITLSSSDGNEVVGNICFNNENGFYLVESSSNTIFHNSIINNAIQVTDSQGGNFWYNADIREGNYWSDYVEVGVDTNNDGIGDTHVPWPDTGFDLYPLMIPTALQERIEVIESKIQDLVDIGILSETSLNPLKVKLDTAIDFIDKGKMFQASKNLDDFISQIDALVNSGRLSVEDGEYLISLAQGVIDVLLTM